MYVVDTGKRTATGRRERQFSAANCHVASVRVKDKIRTTVRVGIQRGVDTIE